MSHRAQPNRARAKRWTDVDVIWAIRARAEELGIKPGQPAPTGGDLGASICAAAVRYCGGLTNATVMAGYLPNEQGRGCAAKMAAHRAVADPPKPKPERVRDPVVAAELKASLRRQAKRDAEHVAACRRVNRVYGPKARHKMKSRSDLGRLRESKWDDFLPPDDLNTSHRRVR